MVWPEWSKVCEPVTTRKTKQKQNKACYLQALQKWYDMAQGHRGDDTALDTKHVGVSDEEEETAGHGNILFVP